MYVNLKLFLCTYKLVIAVYFSFILSCFHKIPFESKRMQIKNLSLSQMLILLNYFSLLLHSSTLLFRQTHQTSQKWFCVYSRSISAEFRIYCPQTILLVECALEIPLLEYFAFKTHQKLEANHVYWNLRLRSIQFSNSRHGFYFICIYYISKYAN